MTSYQPCRWCSLQSKCELKHQILTKPTGSPLPITVVRVSCPTYKKMFRPGQSVSVFLKASFVHEDAYDQLIDGEVEGVIVRIAGNKWLVAIDDKFVADTEINLLSKSGYIRAYPNRITALNTPDQPDRLAELKKRDWQEFDD